MQENKLVGILHGVTASVLINLVLIMVFPAQFTVALMLTFVGALVWFFLIGQRSKFSLVWFGLSYGLLTLAIFGLKLLADGIVIAS